MDSSRLADRLRGILKVPAPKAPGASGQLSGAAGSRDRAELADVLGGRWCEAEGLSCFVVERRREPTSRYGSQPVGAIAASLLDGAADAPLIAGGTPTRPPFVFFDLETTGLSGGAGTYAFLVGCGAFDEEGGFRTRQFLLVRPSDERQVLQRLAVELAPAGGLVTFNGKSFDAPLIETRYLFHRLEWTGRLLPHLDVLHPARRFWGADDGVGNSCSLGALEQHVLGVRRADDVPGADIPARYFQFVRSGDGEPLAQVLEHNRLDLLSLAGLTARLFDLLRRGPGAVRRPREALALGRAYAEGGLDSRARAAYEQAMAMGTLSESGRVEALRSLALLARRARRYDAAAAHWRAVLDVETVSCQAAREASEALAIHHEHRARDLRTAKAFALRCLEGNEMTRETAWNQAVRHRLARLEKKMDASAQPKLFPSSPSRPSSGFPMSARRTSS